MKISSLTKEQTDKFEFYRNKWTAIGTSCEPCDFEKSKHYARLAYKAAGLTCPEKFYLVDSPVAAIELYKKLTNSDDSRAGLDAQIYGSHDSSWLCYYDFMLNELNIEECKQLEGLIGLAENCGWWSPFDECVIFQHRHSEVHLNEIGLHNESGPAVRYRDGYSLWFINGIAVTEQIVMRPETLTIQQIESETSNDVSQIMIDRYGWHNYIKGINAELIDFRENLIEGTHEALYSTPKRGYRLLVTCPTGRIFAMSVPKCDTCEEAQKWMGSDEDVNVIART